MSEIQALEMEVRELRSDNDRLNREIYDLVMNGQSADPTDVVICAQRVTIDKLCGELHQHDRVIARLLDGWEPLNYSDLGPTWQRMVGYYPPQELEQEPMSDGEAAIIRQHQERTA